MRGRAEYGGGWGHGKVHDYVFLSFFLFGRHTSLFSVDVRFFLGKPHITGFIPPLSTCFLFLSSSWGCAANGSFAFLSFFPIHFGGIHKSSFRYDLFFPISIRREGLCGLRV